MAVLEVRDVGYYYYENKKVLDGIQLELEPGTFYADIRSVRLRQDDASIPDWRAG